MPKEDEAPSNLTDLVAKESSDSTASTHPHHQDDKGVATTDDHKANLGPVMAENLGEPASKEESRKRAEELNK